MSDEYTEITFEDVPAEDIRLYRGRGRERSKISAAGRLWPGLEIHQRNGYMIVIPPGGG